jgi:hypothetical protein
MDHVIAVSSYRMHEGHAVHYRDAIPPTAQPYLPERVLGDWYGNKLPNGDFACDLSDVASGEFHLRRCGPAGSFLK